MKTKIEQVKEKTIKELEENPAAWHIDTREKWFLSKLNELEKAVREEIIRKLQDYNNEAKKRQPPERLYFSEAIDVIRSIK